MARTIAAIPQPPAVVCAGTLSRHSAPQRQRESGKECADATSDTLLSRRIVVEFANLALAERAVLVVYLGHRWCYTLRKWFGSNLTVWLICIGVSGSPPGLNQVAVKIEGNLIHAPGRTRYDKVISPAVMR